MHDSDKVDPVLKDMLMVGNVDIDKITASTLGTATKFNLLELSQECISSPFAKKNIIERIHHNF